MGVLFRIREPCILVCPKAWVPQRTLSSLCIRVHFLLPWCCLVIKKHCHWSGGSSLRRCFFKIYVSYESCMHVCLCTPLCLGPIEPEKGLDTLALELRMFLSCYMGLGDKSKFQKSSQFSLPLSHLQDHLIGSTANIYRLRRMEFSYRCLCDLGVPGPLQLYLFPL